MRPRDIHLAHQFDAGLISFEKHVRTLPGIKNGASRTAFIEQLLESAHRVKYVAVIASRDISPLRSDPRSDLFDPLKASIIYKRQNEIDEAFWLVFIFVHFGKHRRCGWRLAREVYGHLNGDNRWSWARVSADLVGFRQWLDANQVTLKANGHFGNHRKYQSLDAYSNSGTGTAFESYVNWVKPFKTHEGLFQSAQVYANGNPRTAFDYMYQSMESVISFGRMARFDYLTMVGKLELASIEPGSAYLDGATGPLAAARLLFHDNRSNNSALDALLIQLGAKLGVGMQIIEDALCNWQKSPSRFIPFRG